MFLEARAQATAVLVCTLLVACGKTTTPQEKDGGRDGGVIQGRTQPTATEMPQVPTSAPCDSLTRQECLGSTHCTLHWIESGVYQCRPDEGPCETGIQQTDKKACIATPGCLYKEASCYCPFPGYGQTAVPDKGTSGNACACGGGSPGTCFPSASTRYDAGAPRDAGGSDAGADGGGAR